MEKKSNLSVLLNGIIRENPTLVLLLGTCPTLAVTTSAQNGLGMGVATLFVLVCSNLVISLLKNVISDKVRIPCYIVIIAGFVTVVQLFLKAFVPSIDKALGVFLPLITVNCIVLGRAEMFASKNKVSASIMDGIGMGLGFTVALFLMGTIREILGTGSYFGIQLIPEAVAPMLIFKMAPGGFFVFGVLIACVNKFTKKKPGKKKTGCAACPSAAACGHASEGGC